MNNLIQLPVSELKTALTGLTKVACRSSCLPVLQSVRVTRDKSGIVNLQATDLDSFATYQTEQPQPGPACEFLVPMESLTKLVKKSSGKSNIGLMGEEGGKVTIRTFVGTSPVDQTVPSVEAKEWPPVPSVEQPGISLDKDFRDAVSTAFDCCGQDSTRQHLQGAWIDVSDPKGHYVFGTDGRHLVSTNSFCLDLRDSVLIPHAKFLDWSGFMEDGYWKLAVQKPKEKKAKDKEESPAWLRLQTNHWTFITKKIDAQCPNWRQTVPSDGSAKTQLRFSQEAVDFLLELLPKLPGYDAPSQPVVLEAGKSELTVKGRSKSSPDWTSIAVPGVEIIGESVSVNINREFVLKALHFGLTDLNLQDALSPLLFRKGGRCLVAMPLRPEGFTPPTPPQATPSSESASTPSPAETNNPNPQPEERKEDMAKTTTEPSAVETPASNETGTKSILQHVEQIKDSLKGVIRDLNDLLDTVKKAEKEKKASEKDIEAVREKLREIQSVKL
jgi:DNA polymerase III sliding clamp (beta) subunit (PCNA family)